MSGIETTVDRAEGAFDDGPDERAPGRRAALITFVVLLLLSAVVILAWMGNQRWFSSDEWDFLVTRRLNEPGDLFRPHNEHWTTLPAVAYRLIWSVVRLRSYWPYQALVVTAHLGAVALLRVVMRRAGVGPWIATAAAAGLLLFGAGAENIVWAFQVTFVGAFALGLMQLLLADHDGRLDRRDWFGLAAGAAALMFSGVGITMAVVVGVATCIRRGWRVALFHTVPLAALYITWWVIERPPSGSNPSGEGVGHIAGVMVSFVLHGLRSGIEGYGASALVGVALAVLLVGGLVLAWRPVSWDRFRRVGSPTAALLVGVVVFLTLSAYGRWASGADYADQSRYVYLVAAMVLPALAVAVDACWRRSSWLGVVAVAVLLAGLPFNVWQFANDDRDVGPQFDATEEMVRATVESPFVDRVPVWVEIDPRVNPGLTTGFLLDRRDHGGLPSPGPIGDETAAQIPVRLGVVQSFGPPPHGDCQTISDPVDLQPERGTIYGFSGGLIAVTPLDDAGRATAPPLKFAPNHGLRLNVLLDDLHIRIQPGTPAVPVTLCE